MRYFPYEKLEINTSLEDSEIRQILKRKIDINITPLELYPFFNSKKLSFKEYRGTVNNSTFKMIRITELPIHYYLPAVFGQIVKSENNYIIKLNIRFHLIVYILLILTTLFIIPELIGLINNNKPDKQHIEIFEDPILDKTLKEVLSDKELNELYHNSNSQQFDWAWIILILLIYSYLIVAFHYESKILKSDLKKMFE